jgi:hypothetical protein
LGAGELPAFTKIEEVVNGFVVIDRLKLCGQAVSKAASQLLGASKPIYRRVERGVNADQSFVEVEHDGFWLAQLILLHGHDNMAE